MNALEEFEQNKARSQLDSWDRYVWARSYLRQLKNQGVDISHYSDYLIGKHYTLTENKFDEIKEFYEQNKSI